MRKITFLGSTSSNYLFGKGRGKDKKKRKSKISLDSIKQSYVQAGKLLPVTMAASGVGPLLGAREALRSGINPLVGIGAGTVNLINVGLKADSQIHKEKLRYKKEGARTRLGKISNDAKIGAKSTAGVVAINTAGRQIARSLTKSKALSLPLKSRVLGVIGSGVAGVIWGSAKGAAIGGGLGTGIGTARGFIQPNKKKSIDKVVRK